MGGSSFLQVAGIFFNFFNFFFSDVTRIEWIVRRHPELTKRLRVMSTGDMFYCRVPSDAPNSALTSLPYPNPIVLSCSDPQVQHTVIDSFASRCQIFIDEIRDLYLL